MKKAAAAAGADLGPVFTRGRAHSPHPTPRAYNAVLRCQDSVGRDPNMTRTLSTLDSSEAQQENNKQRR